MSTVTQQDIISIPRNLLSQFVSEFDKMKKLYDIIDHTLAEKDVEDKQTKTFKNTKDLFDDLDN